MGPALATSIRVVPSAVLSPTEWSTLTDLCVAAFNVPWDDYWESIGPGTHVIVEEAGRGIVAHAAIVDRSSIRVTPSCGPATSRQWRYGPTSSVTALGRRSGERGGPPR